MFSVGPCSQVSKDLRRRQQSVKRSSGPVSVQGSGPGCMPAKPGLSSGSHRVGGTPIPLTSPTPTRSGPPHSHHRCRGHHTYRWGWLAALTVLWQEKGLTLRVWSPACLQLLTPSPKPGSGTTRMAGAQTDPPEEALWRCRSTAVYAPCASSSLWPPVCLGSLLHVGKAQRGFRRRAGARSCVYWGAAEASSGGGCVQV